MHKHIIQSRNKMMLPLNGKTISGALIFLILVSVCNSQPHYYEDDNSTKEPKVRTYHFFIRQFKVTKWVSIVYSMQSWFMVSKYLLVANQILLRLFRSSHVLLN